MKQRIISATILIALSTAVFAQTNKLPKLVIGIVVDQMRYDYLERYREKYSDKGFKRLMNEGFQCVNANYNYVPTYTAPGHASIYTGCTPAVHGIIANDWYEIKNRQMINCVADNNVIPVGSSSEEGKRSPRNLLTTTITDELRLATNMKSKVISISLKDRSAILPGGHTANAAYWYDGKTGNFITSSFYMNELPRWVKEFNNLRLAKKYLNTDWKTLLPVEEYTESTGDDFPNERVFNGEQKPVFPHRLSSLAALNGGFSFLRYTPFGNNLLLDFAKDVVEAENMGQSEITDFLAISFSATDYIGHAYGTNSIETQDAYIRLDQDLGTFIDFIENKLGKDNVLIFLTADHGASQIPAYLKELKIPAGYVNENQLGDSLNAYLEKKYGSKLIATSVNQQIYFNHRLLADKKLLLKEVSETAVAFLKTLPVVEDAVSSAEIENNADKKGFKLFMKNGYHKKRSGDVLINYMPGYVDHYSFGTSHGSPYSYDTHVPLLFYGWNILKGSTAKNIVIPDIAATLAVLLRIQFPSGNNGTPIEMK